MLLILAAGLRLFCTEIQRLQRNSSNEEAHSVLLKILYLTPLVCVGAQ